MAMAPPRPFPRNSVIGTNALLLGFGMGLRHALDADHVVVLSTLMQREPGPLPAARLAALWGAGHTASFLLIGLPIILLGFTVPPAIEVAVELLVAAMLVGLGALHFSRAGSPTTATSRAATRPLMIGVVHGLAGSAGVGLLAATTVASRTWAALYLGLFGLGTVLGMVLLTLAFAVPIGWTLRRQGTAGPWLARVSGGLSVAMGLFMVFWAGAELAAE
jgi:nickel/cobalt exporter